MFPFEMQDLGDTFEEDIVAATRLHPSNLNM